MNRSALVLASTLLLLTAGCSGGSALPGAGNLPAPGGAALSPLVWQRGTPPVHWTMLRLPSTNQDEAVYSWPLTDGAFVAFGLTCCYPGGSPPLGSIEGMNVSGGLVNVPNGNPGNGGLEVEAVPIKLFRCSNGTMICANTRYGPIGPGQRLYYADNQSAPDAAGGLGDDVWFTTCCNGSYIVRGRNGTRDFFRIPNTRDRLGDVAVTPDGNVWVTLQHQGTTPWILAKLDPTTSHVTEYPLQLPSSPAQLYVSRDGDLWFAIGTTLYRVVPGTAAVTRSTLTEPSNGYLADGPGGSIWTGYVAAPGEQGLLELGASGKALGTFACPASVCVSGTLEDRILQLTAGPDGNMWFAFSNTQLFSLAPPDDPNEGLGVYVLQSMDVIPASLTFTAPRQTAMVTVSEANYGGTWTAASTQPSVARAVRFVTPHQIEIESVGAGSARIIIRDTKENYYGLDVTVR
jgi:hypothetical protein